MGIFHIWACRLVLWCLFHVIFDRDDLDDDAGVVEKEFRRKDDESYQQQPEIQVGPVLPAFLIEVVIGQKDALRNTQQHEQ
jgi:hypothetical protein